MPKQYLRVASLKELPPGHTLRVEPEQHPVLLANVDGSVYACDDTCTHEDSSLSLGCLKGDLVKCTLHGSWFNVRSGEPTEEPADTPLRTYPVRIDQEDIFVLLVPN